MLFLSVPATVIGQEPINVQKEIFVTSSQYLLIESAVFEFRKHNVGRGEGSCGDVCQCGVRPSAKCWDNR